MPLRRSSLLLEGWTPLLVHGASGYYGVVKRLPMGFLRWLFPALFSPYAKCSYCGSVGLKQDMVRGYGWFCTEEESGEFWVNYQM
jgi:hypothetical protein